MVYVNRHKDQNTIINYNLYFKLVNILFIETLLTFYIILLIDNILMSWNMSCNYEAITPSRIVKHQQSTGKNLFKVPV